MGIMDTWAIERWHSGSMVARKAKRNRSSALANKEKTPSISEKLKGRDYTDKLMLQKWL